MFSEKLMQLKYRLIGRKQAYVNTFSSESGKAVLKDLAKFCFGGVSTFHPDARVHAEREGRREVWDRICYHLHLHPNNLFELYVGKDSEE